MAISAYRFSSANSQKVTDLLFWTPPRRFHRFPRNFAHSICGLSWHKFIKIMLIIQTILTLLDNNFLYILLKTKRISTLVCLNDMKPRWLLPHEPLRLCEKMINLLFRTPPRPFDWFATNFASSICGQNLSKAFTYVTHGGTVHFDASP